MAIDQAYLQAGWQNPLESINQSIINGYNFGAKVEQAQQQREQLAVQKQRQQQMNESLYHLSQNQTPENYAQVMTRFPELSDSLKKAYDTMDDGEKKSAFSVSSQAYAAIANGQPDIAKQVLNDAATAYENSGKTKQANTLKGYVKMLENNPNAARTSLGILMSSADPDKFKDVYGTFGSEQRANELQPYAVQQAGANVAQTKAGTQGQIIENQYKPQQLQSGIDQTKSQTTLNYANVQNLSDRYNLDKDKLATETQLRLAELNQKAGQLSDGVQKIRDDNITNSTASLQQASKLDALADGFEKAANDASLVGVGWGKLAAGKEGVLRSLGIQTDVSKLRTQYEALSSSQAMASLKAGGQAGNSMTDADMKIAMKGFPPKEADAKYLASWLRGTAKIERINGAISEARGEWVNTVNGLQSPNRDIEVLGVRVPKGTTFNKFVDKNLNQLLKNSQSSQDDRDRAMGNRPYMIFAQ